MSSGVTLPYFRQQFYYNGKPVSGGSLTFLVGGSTNLPKAIYYDYAKSIVAPNPLTLDSDGLSPQYFGEDGLYKIVLKNSAGQILDTRDYIEGASIAGATGDHKVLASATDTIASYLDDKIAQGSGITIALINGTTGKAVSISHNGTFKLNSSDATPGYLVDKVDADANAGLSWSVVGGKYKLGSSNWVAVSATDTTPAPLQSKLANSSTLTWAIGNPGANENLSATVNFSAWTDAYKVKTLGTDAAGYLGSKIASSASVATSIDSNGIITWTCLGAPPTGLAGGDLTGTYPNPLVKELSGLGVSWDSINAQWVAGGTFDPPAGVYSCAFKAARGYGLLVNKNGNLYVTKDGGKTWTDAGYQLNGSGSARDIEYGKVNATNNGFAVIFNNSVAFIEDIPASYDANGIPLQASWQSGTIAALSAGADIAYNATASVWLFAEQDAGVTYCQYLNAGTITTNTVIPQGATGYAGAVFFESNTNKLVYVERGTGRVWWALPTAYSLPSNWTEVKVGTVPVLKYYYPSLSDSNGFGTGVSMGGISAFAGNAVISTTDVTDSSKYMMSFNQGTLPALWNINTDGANWYATTVNATTPVLYQLWLGSIPAHRQLIAEQGIVIEGQGVLQDLPNAQYLGTDAWGNIIAKSAPNPNPNGYGYSATMQVANATTILAPNLIGLRNELTVLFVPFADMDVTYNLSMFGCYLSQGGTGNLTYTLRDEQYRLIAASASVNNPSPSVFLELVCGLVQDPITQASLNSYTLKMGNRYNLGISWTANGIQLLGDETNQNTNITPYPAYKVDNVTGGIIYQLTGGGESKMRPFVRLLTGTSL